MNRLTLFFISHLVCISAVVLFGFGNVVQATIIADVRGDYVAGTNNGDPGILSATGTGTWNYLASDTTNPTLDGTLDLLLWDSSVSVYRKLTSGGSGNTITDQHSGLASDEIFMHPSGWNRSPDYDVARWIAGVGEAGIINISGNVRMLDTTGQGSVTFDIFVDGNSIFNTTLLQFTGTASAAFNQTWTVGVGSTVDFVVGPNGGDIYDSTALSAAIDLTQPIPEPTTMLLLGIGLAGLAGGAARRRLRKNKP